MIIQPSFGGCLHLRIAIPIKKTSFGGCLPRDTGNTDKKEAPLGLLQGALRKGAATYSPGLPVPSAWRGLTSLFGMGRGGTPAL